jgi:hypothetical protein
MTAKFGDRHIVRPASQAIRPTEARLKCRHLILLGWIHQRATCSIILAIPKMQTIVGGNPQILNGAENL